MKNLILATTVVLLWTLGFGGNALAVSGGTKGVAGMASPVKAEPVWSPLIVPSHDEWMPTKTVGGFLGRIPKPTLSLGAIREERPGRTSGTKAVVLFQMKSRA